MKKRKHGEVLVPIKSRLLKGKNNKIKYDLTAHAKKRLLERFGKKDGIGKIYPQDVEILTNYEQGKRAWFLKKHNMIIIRKKRSTDVITVMTPEMWNKWEFNRCWQEAKDKIKNEAI